MEVGTYIKKEGVFYEGVLKDIRKSGNFLQPILEAVTNSLEAISLRTNKADNGYILIQLYSNKNLLGDLEFDKLTIEDSGIGFNDENFERALIYKDNRKGFNNKGSGRIQLLHFFDKSEYESIYQSNSGFKKRTFTLSKAKNFLDNNSIVFYSNHADVEGTELKTVLTLRELLEGSGSSYNTLTVAELKQAIVAHYMLYFCSHRETMPQIILKHYCGTELLAEEKIESSDIPQFEKEEDVTLYYSELSADAKSITKTNKKEKFKLRAFKIEKDRLEKNAIKLTSKDEIVENVKIPLDCLLPEDHIEGKRYLFLLSDPYIDKKDTDVRGEFKIPSREDFKKQNDLFSTEEILLEDIQEATNQKVLGMYKEIQENTEQHKQDIEKLKKMFLLNEDTVKHLTISLNDTEDKILEKVYAAEAKSVAKKDAEIKKKIDELEHLDPTASNYETTFDETISELVKQIPLQNRTTLTHYVARRKLVLELFDKILKKELKVQLTTQRNIDEKLLHNLIFQQTADSPDRSDLWLVNEDFIFFRGTSEAKLGDLEVDGIKILKETLTAEEEEYRKSLGEDRYTKRPDILLFPAENKCIILEFKNPDVNISEHLNQINRYSSIIRNLSKDEFQFDTFYGYLIGEKVSGDDVRDFDGDFKHSYQFDYVFRPAKTIAGRFGRKDGSIYMEVIKYSTLLKRAQVRNSIFLNKILETGKK